MSSERERGSSRWESLGRVLVGTDGSDHATQAVDFAIGLAVEHGAELDIVEVLPAFDVVPGGMEDVGYALPHEPTGRERTVLADASARAAERGVPAATALLAGPPADAIAAQAESRGVDLIVVGSCGHGAIARMLLGSVSLGVLRKATRPVLIVRAADGPHTADLR